MVYITPAVIALQGKHAMYSAVPCRPQSSVAGLPYMLRYNLQGLHHFVDTSAGMLAEDFLCMLLGC